MIDYVTSLWHWNVEAFKHEILKPKKFEKILKNESVIYALILNNKNEDVVILIILCKIVNYTDVFFKKNAGKLSEHEESDHVIKLNEQNSLFELLYNLSSLKLKTLWKYFDDVLVKRWIRHFTSSVGTPVLFVFKKDDDFHFCVNY